MYFSLDRTQKSKRTAMILALVSVVLAIIGYCCGGRGLIWSGSLDREYARGAILMAAACIGTVVFSFLCVWLRGLEQDILENLKRLEQDKK